MSLLDKQNMTPEDLDIWSDMGDMMVHMWTKDSLTEHQAWKDYHIMLRLERLKAETRVTMRKIQAREALSTLDVDLDVDWTWEV